MQYAIIYYDYMIHWTYNNKNIELFTDWIYLYDYIEGDSDGNKNGVQNNLSRSHKYLIGFALSM